MLGLFVKRDLLIETGYLLVRGDVPPQVKLPPHHIGYQHAHRLSGSAGRPYGPCEQNVHELGPVFIPFDLHVGDPFQRGDEYPFGQNGQSHSDGPFERFLGAFRRTVGHLLGHHKGNQLPVLVLGGEAPDVLGDAFDVEFVEKFLHAGREVLRLGHFHIRFGVDPQYPGLIRYRVADVLLPRKFGEVIVHLLARGRTLTHPLPPPELSACR